jgi:hypothetical protein
MAKFKALSNIQHGTEDKDGTPIIMEFPHGSIVEGLDKDTMKKLWDAGVLEQVDETPLPTVKTTVRPTTDPSAPSQGPASGTEGETPSGDEVKSDS